MLKKRSFCSVIFSIVFFVLFSILENGRAFAQSTQPTKQTAQTSVVAEPSDRKISDADWQRAKKGIDYSRSAAEKKRLEAERKRAEDRERNGKKHKDSAPMQPFSPSFFNGMSVVAKTIFIAFIVALVALLLYFLSKSALFLGNAEVNTEFITLEEVENDLHESDLERFLRQALDKNDYRLALRIYYLMILKALSLKEFIEWKKDKTNYEYCRELRPQPDIYPQFQAITGLFERVWYGDTAIQKEDYDHLQPIFHGLLKQI